MTSAEAREHMDAALDGELSQDEQVAFDSALARDASLREEYEDHARVLAETRSLGKDKAAQGVDLLAGVQQRLRERSGGKFYRDRFAEALGQSGHSGQSGQGRQTLGKITSSVGLMIALALIVLVAVTAWLAFDAGVLSPPQVTP